MNTSNRFYDLRMLTENRQELYGVATLWIIIFHSDLCNICFPTGIGELISYGNMGCEVFLFLSGICLYFSFRGDEQYVPFIKRRLIRLYVPIVLICTWYWLYQLLQTGLSCRSLGTLAANFLTLSLWLTGDAQIWFISLLMLVYCLYPLIYRILSGRKRPELPAAMLLILSVGIALLLETVAPIFYERTEVALTRLPIFLIGCYFGQKVYERKPFPRWVIPVCAILFCGVIAVLHIDVLHDISRRYLYLFGGISLTFSLSWLFHAIRWKPFHAVFAFFGNMSLELYLLNIILIRLYRMMPFYDSHHPSTKGYIALLAVNTVLAYAAYRIGKRLTPPIQKRLLNKKST